MEKYKEEFIKFMIKSEALKFGDFTLKSGRKSPFFMNLGSFVTGKELKQLGKYYATAIHNAYGDNFDILFGPAYKGIPLSVITAEAFYELYGQEKKYSSNRKEIKDHGDTGILLGSKIKSGDKVVIIEDVTTSGKSIEETYPIIKSMGNPEIVGMMVSLDRGEKGKSNISALKEVSNLYGFPTGAIVTMNEVVDYLYNKEISGKVIIDEEIKSRIEDYYKIYGA